LTSTWTRPNPDKLKSCLITVSWMYSETMIPRLAWLLFISCLSTGASTIRAVTMMDSPETPTLSVVTGPTLTATRIRIRAGS
jgi:hypothetical protein